MKKITLVFMFFAFAFFANSQVLLDETFAGFPASNDVTGIPTAGWLNYAGNIGPVATDTRTVLTSAMAYSDAAGLTMLSGTGNSLYNFYAGLSGNNYITYKAFSATPIISGKVYMSFLLNVEKQGGSQGEVVGLTDSIHRNSTRCWIKAGTDATNYKLGLTRTSGGSADIVLGTKTMYYNTVYLMVYKFDFATGIASYFVNPAIGSTTESTPDLIDDGTKQPLTAARTSLQYIMFRNGGSNKAYYWASSFRVCQSWTDAVAAFKSELPKVATPAVGSATLVDTEKFTARWTAVANAAGYSVYVYNGATQFAKVSVDGQSTSSLEITSLISNTTYTYKVQANGDNLNYAGSALSASSATFTTANGATSLNPDFSDGSWGTVYASSLDEPASGSFPVFTTPTGFLVSHGLCSSSPKTGPLGEVHANSLKLDKGSAGGMIIFPSLKTVSNLEIHAWTGTALRTFVIQELQSDGSWTAGTTYTTGAVANVDSIFNITMVRNLGTKLRLVNTGGGAVNIGTIRVNLAPNALNEFSENVAFYANGKTIHSSEAGIMTVYNLQGAQMLRTNIQNTLLTKLPSGLYMAQLKTNSGNIVTRKIMIQ